MPGKVDGDTGSDRLGVWGEAKAAEEDVDGEVKNCINVFVSEEDDGIGREGVRVGEATGLLIGRGASGSASLALGWGTCPHLFSM